MSAEQHRVVRRIGPTTIPPGALRPLYFQLIATPEERDQYTRDRALELLGTATWKDRLAIGARAVALHFRQNFGRMNDQVAQHVGEEVTEAGRRACGSLCELKLLRACAGGNGASLGHSCEAPVCGDTGARLPPPLVDEQARRAERNQANDVQVEARGLTLVYLYLLATAPKPEDT